MEVVAKEGTATREVVAAAVGSMPECVRKGRISALQTRRGCRALYDVAENVLADPCNAPTLTRAVRDVFGPLPALRQADDLTAVEFADQRPRSLADARGQVTVLWFFLPDDPRLGDQIAAVAPAVTELMASGVQVLALAACTEPKAASNLARAKSLPCPVGAYAFNAQAPWQGVDYFPAAVVLDQDGRLVYDDHGPEHKEYAAFASTARGLRNFLQTRPLLVQG
jgi:hypothetical protein